MNNMEESLEMERQDTLDAGEEMTGTVKETTEFQTESDVQAAAAEAAAESGVQEALPEVTAESDVQAAAEAAPENAEAEPVNEMEQTAECGTKEESASAESVNAGADQGAEPESEAAEVSADPENAEAETMSEAEQSADPESGSGAASRAAEILAALGLPADPYAKISIRTHRESGARIADIIFGAVDADGALKVPRNGDGHGHLLAVELNGKYEQIFLREPAGVASEPSQDPEVLFQDDRESEAAKQSGRLQELASDISERRMLVRDAERMIGSFSGSAGQEETERLREKWAAIRVWSVPREKELETRFEAALSQYMTREEGYEANRAAKEEIIARAAKTAVSPEAWGQRRDLFRDLMNEWRRIGSAGKEADEQLFEAFHGQSQVFYEKREQFYKELHAREEENAKRKEALISEAAALTEFVQNWKASGDELNNMMERWKTIGSAGHQEKELWDRFNEIRKKFFEGRRAFFHERDQQRLVVAEKKRQLVERAHEITGLHDYSKENADRMKELSVLWKAAGSAGHETDEKLWIEFRAAQDVFWDNKRSEFVRNRQDNSQKRLEAIERRERKIEHLKSQNENLQFRLATLRSEEYIENNKRWIAENEEKIRVLQEEIEEIRNRD